MPTFESIWIIDDDPIVVFGIRKMLLSEYPDLPISAFSNGKQALDAVQQALQQNGSLPDLILLDINMPIMDGWQFLEGFLNLPVETPLDIVIITSSIDPADTERWEGFQPRTHHRLGYKNKPIRKADLIAMVKAA
jgi:CheY-like chemotaxis protein